MPASVALPQPSQLAATASAQASRIAWFTQRRRWWIVGACVVAQWLFVAREAFDSIAHNGWIYADGNDGPWYWTSAWTLSSLHVPVTGVGLGWPYLLSPLAALIGPNLTGGLPIVILLNVLILAPASVIGMYLVAEQLAGRVFGVWTAILWTVLPAVSLLLYNPAPRRTLVGSFLPTALGLNALSDYPSMVCAIFAALFVLRSIDGRSDRDATLAGVLMGFLVLLKPGNAPLVVAAFVVFAVAREVRVIAVATIWVIPALVALTLWKRTGYGEIPLFALGRAHEAAGGIIATPAEVGGIRSYVKPDWHHFMQEVHALAGVFWSLRLLEFALVAGSLGLLARCRLKGLFVVLWFLIFGLVKATVAYAGVYDTSVFRFLLPAWPAWVLIVAAVPFCFPIGKERRRHALVTDRARLQGRHVIDKRLVVATAFVLAAGPLAVAAAASSISTDTVAQLDYKRDFSGAPVPVVDFALRAERTAAKSVRLRWADQDTSPSKTSYAVFQARDDGCAHRPIGARVCYLRMQYIGATDRTTWVDAEADSRFVYRVGLVPSASELVDPDGPPLLMLSKPLTVGPE